MPPRTARLVATAAAAAAIVWGMVALRSRASLDDDGEVITAVLVLVGGWLVAQSIALVVRQSRAGHALRLDDAGLHLPGWDVVPWPAIRKAAISYGSRGRLSRFGEQLALTIDPACRAPSRGDYTRWLFGPIEGLRRRPDKPIRVPLAGMRIDGATLLAAVDAWRVGDEKTRRRT